MKRKLCIASLLCLVSLMMSAFYSEAQEDQEDIPSLIKQLEDNRLYVRQRAKETLIQIGQPCYPSAD